MRHPQQPPLAPPHHPYTPGMPAVAPQGFYEPPTQPLPRPQAFPVTPQRGPFPYPHPHLPPGANLWAPTAFTARGPRVGLRRKRLPLYLGGALTAITAAVLFAGLLAPGFLVTKQLDVRAVAAGVTHVLSDPNGYAAKNVSDVTCNDGQNPTVLKGASFTCQATIDHIKHQFTVTFTDDAGGYEVSAPKGTKI